MTLRWGELVNARRVVVQYTGRGIQDGAWGSLPPTGKPFVLSGVTVYRFVGDRIVEEWTYAGHGCCRPGRPGGRLRRAG